jgi:hypothetical protein
MKNSEKGCMVKYFQYLQKFPFLCYQACNRSYFFERVGSSVYWKPLVVVSVRMVDKCLVSVVPLKHTQF